MVFVLSEYRHPQSLTVGYRARCLESRMIPPRALDWRRKVHRYSIVVLENWPHGLALPIKLIRTLGGERLCGADSVCSTTCRSVISPRPSVGISPSAT